jgi:hypothetical protein
VGSGVVFDRVKSHIETLRLLEVGGYLSYLVFKRLDPVRARLLYARHRCPHPFLPSVRYGYRRSRGSRGYVVEVSTGLYRAYNVVYASTKHYLRDLLDFSIGALEEISCGHIYDIDPRGYDYLVDIGSTLGEFSLYMLAKGFRGWIVSVEPLVYTRLYEEGEPLDHTHYSIFIEGPGDFNKIFRDIYGRAIVKIDCEGCEKHLRPHHLGNLEPGSMLLLGTHGVEIEIEILPKLLATGFRIEKQQTINKEGGVRLYTMIYTMIYPGVFW